MNWLALRFIPGLGNRTALKLVNAVGSASGVFRASATELESLGAPSHVVRSLATGSVFEQAIKEADQARQAGAALLTMRDEAYPESLREIFDPPLTLYVRGNVALLKEASVAIVGSRKPTAYGRAI